MYFDKEVHFFDYPDRYSQGMEFYAKRFSNCGKDRLSMDATPNTFRFPKKVHDTYHEAGAGQISKVKIILVVRDPISRELSLYNHMLTKYLETQSKDAWFSEVASEDGSALGFDEYVEKVLEPNLAEVNQGLKTSFYAHNIGEWSRYFSRDQILVLSYDEVHMKPKLAQDRVCNFLGSNFPGELPVSNNKETSSKVHAISCSVRERLDRIFKEKNDKLYSLLDQSPGPLMEQRPFPKLQQVSCT